MSIYLPKSLLQFEERRMVFSTWVDHMAFGYDIVEAVRPGLLVELGTYNGLSFFTFCQSMQENDVEGLCYAVDSWEGDDHTEDYDESIYLDVERHAREYYRGFAYLMKMQFNEALRHFESDSIDLLHIDGLHTYEAVREDFENWYPKLSPGGLMLIHDVRARLKDFGAWKFWDEISPHYPSFTFEHGYGLGVLRKPGGPDIDHPLLSLLFEFGTGDARRLRQLYVHSSSYLEAKRRLKRPHRAKKGRVVDRAGTGKSHDSARRAK